MQEFGCKMQKAGIQSNTEENEVINADIAKRFIENIATFTSYNVNVMDVNGTIIASRHHNRIGTYHEAAKQMIESNQEIIDVFDENNLIGVKPGVNLIVHSDDHPVGVVGVTGEPDKVHEIAMIIKMALETMIRYDVQRERSFKIQGIQYQFYFALFNESTSSAEKLKSFAEKLNFNESIIRIPILLTFEQPCKTEQILSVLSSSLKGEDMHWSVDNRHILIYKAMNYKSKDFTAIWKQEIVQWISELKHKADFKYAFVGSMQCRLSYYRYGFNHCRWLEKNIIYASPDENVIFFMDYLHVYLPSALPGDEVYAVWNVYDKLLTKNEKSNIIQVIGALRRNNYNLVATSQQLYIHKNTLSFRLNKLKNLLGVNPIKYSNDRFFMDCLLGYLQTRM